VRVGPSVNVKLYGSGIKQIEVQAEVAVCIHDLMYSGVAARLKKQLNSEVIQHFHNSYMISI